MMNRLSEACDQAGYLVLGMALFGATAMIIEMAMPSAPATSLRPQTPTEFSQSGIGIAGEE